MSKGDSREWALATNGNDGLHYNTCADCRHHPERSGVPCGSGKFPDGGLDMGCGYEAITSGVENE